VEFGLLGPLLVEADGARVTVSAGKQRVLLATLLLQANQVVSAAGLAEAIWEGNPPGSARVTLQNYVKRLRQALGPAGYERIVTRPVGYLIQVGPGELDLARFTELQQAGRAAVRTGSWEVASAQLGTALGLWRGEPLADVPSRRLVQAEVPRLAEMRLETLEARIDADLHLGRHREVIAELQALIAAEPLRERLHELLMLALYRSGQQGIALAAYRHVRRQLVDEVGIEPGPGLRDLNQRILRSDAQLLLAPQPPASAAGQRDEAKSPDVPEQASGDRGRLPRPNMLPAGVAGFTGRVRELAVLSGLVGGARGAAGGTGGVVGSGGAAVGGVGGPVVVAIGGTAGVGKTALAVHWARSVAGEFPDGQLYVNLRGFGPSEPLAPAEALRGFLDALQVPAGQVPGSVEGRAALLGGLVAGRRVLMVLDNARDAGQVRPLLAGSGGCVVVVTSRAELAGLVVAEGAVQLGLDVLSVGEARLLLAGRLGSGRVAAEPAAADELIGLCARLPLALAITAARAVAHPGFGLAALAGELGDARGRLDALSTGEDSTDVRAVLSWSYRKLGVRAARLLRLLGLHPGPDITVAAAASLAGTDAGGVRGLLRELTRWHLLAEPVPGRYAFHDLLRAYAAERAAAEDSEADRHAAIHRMLDHYLHTAYAAALVINRARGTLDLAPIQPGAVPEAIDGHDQALAWFTAEHQVLLALIGRAVEAGFDGAAWQLPWTLTDYLQWQGQWHELVAIQRTAVAATERLGDTAAQANGFRSLGRACFGLRAWGEARAYLSQALQLCQELGDGLSEARTRISLGFVMERLGHYREALDHARRALALFEQADNRPGQARALNNIGWYHALLGDHHQALLRSKQALDLQRELGDRCGEANTWDTLGLSHRQLGHYTKSASCYQEAISRFTELGDRTGEAETLIHLGDMRSAAGSRLAAIAAWRQALRLLDELHLPDAEQVRDKLKRATAELAGPAAARTGVTP
jgi:DNA-binding SARP family transcriptional activator/tetratricopeptide (TPR) repeat protein